MGRIRKLLHLQRASLAFALALPVLSSGCMLIMISNESEVTSQGAGSSCPASAVLAVEAYFSNAPDWNDYVEATETSIADQQRTSAACNLDGKVDGGTRNGQYLGFGSCRHGGEVRLVKIPAAVPCAKLTASDALGAFDWRCVEKGSETWIYSHALKEGKGLRDLIHASGAAFASNTVSVSHEGCGELYTTSAGSAWWSNAFYALTANAGSGSTALSNAGGIYVHTADVSTDGYALTANRISIVSMGTSRINFNAALAGNNCNLANGLNDGSNDQRCVLTAGGRTALWLEADVDGTTGAGKATVLALAYGAQFARLHRFIGRGGLSGVNFVSTSFSRITETTITGQDAASMGDSVSITNGRANLIHKTRGRGGSGVFTLITSPYNLLVDVEATQVTYFCIQLYAQANRIYRAKTTGCSQDGLSLYLHTDNNTVVGMFSTNNGIGINNCWNNNGCNRNTYHLSTLANNSWGFRVSNTGGGDAGMSTLSQALIVNNATGYMSLPPDTNNLLAHSAFYGNTTGIVMDSDLDIVRGSIVMGGNGTNCSVTAGATTPGLTSACGESGGSNFDLHTGLDLSATFSSAGTPRVTVQDDSNGSNNAGLQAVGAITDFFNFANPWRSWGREAASWPNATARTRCTAGNCRIWDFSMDKDDTAILGRSETGVSAKATFSAGEACPAAVHGNLAITDHNNMELYDGVGDNDGICEAGEVCNAGNTYLLNAMEIVLDDIGDDDGLCESDEACIYAPNFGAYQGHGALSQQTCDFTDGTVEGVLMYGYESNGY